MSDAAAPPGPRDRGGAPRPEAVPGGAPLALVPSRIPGGVAASIDALAPEALPRLRFEGPLAALRPRLRAAVAERMARPRWLANWLVDDVAHKAGLLVGLTGAAAIRLSLGVVTDDRCSRFHVDDLRFRLVTTYRGPGTEWVPPRVAALLAPGALPPPDAVCHLARGEVAILRGARGAAADAPAVLHRSPPVAGTGIVRLLLTVDEIGRRLH